MPVSFYLSKNVGSAVRTVCATQPLSQCNPDENGPHSGPYALSHGSLRRDTHLLDMPILHQQCERYRSVIAALGRLAKERRKSFLSGVRFAA